MNSENKKNENELSSVLILEKIKENEQIVINKETEQKLLDQSLMDVEK